MMSPWGWQMPMMAMMAAAPFGMHQAPAQMPHEDMANANQQNKPEKQKTKKTNKKKTKKKEKTKKEKRTRVGKDNKEKKKKKKKKNTKKAPQTHLELALQEAGNAAKEQFQEATSRTMGMDVAMSAAFQVPVRSLLDTLGVQALELHSTIMRFFQADAVAGGFAYSHWFSLLMAAFPELECSGDVDLMVLSIVLQCRRNRASNPALLNHFVEFSAGSAMLTLQCLLLGLRGCGLDKVYGIGQDNTTTMGLRLWFNELTRTAAGGLLWFGTQCSSFSAMCSSNHRRKASNNFLGDPSEASADFVMDGNDQMILTSILWLLGHLLDCSCCLEQPLGSVMPQAPPLSTVLKFVQAERVVTWHSAFGAPSAKPLQLWSNNPVVQTLRRKKPTGMKLKPLATRGGGTFSGVGRRLKGSECYTAEFGKAVAEAFFRAR